MDTRALFVDHSIVITRMVIRINNVLYDIRSIDGVSIGRPDSAIWYVLAFVTGLIASVLFIDTLRLTSLIYIIASVVSIVIGMLRPYRLMMRTVTGDQQALASRKLEDLENIKAAIEEAVRLYT